MHVWVASAVIGGVTAGVSWVTCAPLTHWLRKHGHVDVPGRRSSHVGAVPRGGGLALGVGYVIGALVLANLSRVASSFAPSLSAQFWALIVLPLLACALGAIEDLRGISIRLRLIGQALLGAGAAAWLLPDNSWLVVLALATVFSVIAYINIANFMDGINGISSAHGILVAATFLWIGLNQHHEALAQASAVLGGAAIGFLPWNVPRARAFLGDAGSYLLGAAAVTLVISALLDGTPADLAVAPLAIYVADTSWTLLRRWRRGERLGTSHRSHVYQRLTDHGLSHVAATAVVSVCSIGIVVLAAIGSQELALARSGCDLAALIMVVGYLATPRLLQSRRRILG